jgi:cation:H+ antiporter
MLVLLLLGGLGALVLGADLFVRGVSRIAARLGVPPLIIGLTVVAMGTSAPEVAISVQGAIDGRSGIAIGNAVGSNIFNVLFILGLSALIAPLAVARQLIRLDVPLMIVLSLLSLGLAWNGSIERWEGGLLLLLGVVYICFLIRQAAREPAVADDEFARVYGPELKTRRRSWLIDLVLGAIGLTLLVLGCRWFVAGAVSVARALEISELVIGLTIVAAGTSLPEVATSVVASIRGERDIAVGNVIGSNIFNLVLVIGLSSVIAPAGLTVSEQVLRFDLPIMIVVAAACLPIFLTGHRIDRWEGGLFLVSYLIYVAWLVVESLAHPAWLGSRTVALAIAVSLLGVTMAVVLGRSAGRARVPSA